jgi:hypothetical protein
MITPTDVRAAENRRHDLLTSQARVRFAVTSRQDPAASDSSKTTQMRATLRHALASFVAFVFIA